VAGRRVGDPQAARYRSFTMLERDTTPDVQAAQIAALRRLGPEKRVGIAASMSEDARRIALDGIRRAHPEYSEREAKLSLFRRLWGNEMFERVWGRELSPR
jgi:hypothetical protein